MGSDAGAETGPYAVVTANTASRSALAEELFTANYPKLAGWVRRLVDDDETAHEIASEAFVRLLSKWTSPDKLDNQQGTQQSRRQRAGSASSLAGTGMW